MVSYSPRQAGLAFVCMYMAWILVDSACAYFVFHGNPPVAVVAMKDTLLALFILGGVAIALASDPVVRLQSWAPRFRWFYALVIIASIYFVVDLVRAGDPVESLHGLRDFLAPFIVLLVGNVIGGRKGFNARFFVNFVALAFAVVMALAVYQYLFFSVDDLTKYGIVNQEHARMDPSSFLQIDSNGIAVGRVRGLGVFDSPLILGIVSVMAILNSWIGMGWSKGIKRALHGGVIAIAFLALFVSFSRAAQLGLVVAALVVARASSKRGWLIGLFLVAILLPIVIIRTFNGFNVDPSTLSHIVTYARAIDLLRARPLGYGISFAGTRATQTGFDGDYLNVLMNVGPIGLTLFVLAFRTFYRQAKQFASTPRLQTTSLAIRGMLIAYMLTMVALMIRTDGGCRVIDLWLGVMLGYGTAHLRRDHIVGPHVSLQPAQSYSQSEITPGYI